MDQITFYETEDGKVRIAVRFEHENLWLSQKLLAELFECSSDNISLHLKNIFKAGELDPDAVNEEYSATAADGKNYLRYWQAPIDSRLRGNDVAKKGAA